MNLTEKRVKDCKGNPFLRQEKKIELKSLIHPFFLGRGTPKFVSFKSYLDTELSLKYRILT